MTITFSIEYETRWGEELYLMLGNDRYSAVKMNYNAGGIWTVSYNVSESTRQLRYRYLVKESGEVTRMERCECHILNLQDGVSRYLVDDYWNDENGALRAGDFIARLTSARERTPMAASVKLGHVIIEAEYPLARDGHKPALVGESAVLGVWNVRRAVPMQPCGDSIWRAELVVPLADFPCQFKLITIGKRGAVEWESGDNRWMRQPPHDDEVLLLNGLKFRRSETIHPRVATVIEVAALRSDRDMGCGDLGDLKKVIQWAATTGQDAVSLNSLADGSVVDGWMPVDTRKRVLENAIDPVFVNLPALGTIADKKLKAQYQKAGMALNALDNAALDEVRRLKLDYGRTVFADNGASVVRSAAYRKFVAENGEWLRPYAAQAILQQVNSTAESAGWGIYSAYNPEQIEKFLKARHREAAFQYYLQFQLRQQLIDAAQYARTKKVILSCDMAPRNVKALDLREPWVNQRFLEQRLNQGGEMVLVPLRDWLIIDGDYLARVAKSSSSRLPISIEELTAAREFNTRLTSIVNHQPQSQQ